MKCVSVVLTTCLILIHLSRVLCDMPGGHASNRTAHEISEVPGTETEDASNNSMTKHSQREHPSMNNTVGSAKAPVTCPELSQNHSLVALNHSFSLDARGYEQDCCGNVVISGKGRSEMEQLKLSFQFMCEGILLPIIAIPGFICNVVNIYVLTRDAKSSANTLYLTGLSIADLSFLLFALVNWAEYMLKMLNYPAYVVFVTGMHAYWIRSFAIPLAGRVSNLLIVVLSLERFVVVKFPFAAKTLWLSRHPIKVLMGLFIFVTCAFLPNIFRWKYIEVFDPVVNRTSAIIVQCNFEINNEYILQIYGYFLLVFLRCLPIFLTVVLNIAIAVTLKFSRVSLGTNPRSDDKRRTKELKVTRMLLVVSLLFSICVTPGLIHSLLGNSLPGYSFFGYNSQFFKIFFYIYPLFDTLNSTVNFFVYVFMSDNFRKIFIDIFRRKG